MLAQRPVGAAPAGQAGAEALPLRGKSVDAALGVLTVHHWQDVHAGVAELRRVAWDRIVLFTWYPDVAAPLWLADYLPAAATTDAALVARLHTLRDLLPDATVTPLPIPHDCWDGFAAAYWRRPAAYLDPAVRAGIPSWPLR
jgi:hypothetical protein